MKKVWILMRGIEAEIARKSLRKDTEFKGFVDINEINKQEFSFIVNTAGMDTYFITHDVSQLDFLKHYGIKRERMIPFCTGRWFSYTYAFEVVSKKNWIRVCADTLKYNTLLKFGNHKVGEDIAYKIIDTDMMFLKKHHRNKRIVIIGYNEYTKQYVEKANEFLWGIVDKEYKNSPLSCDIEDILYEDTKDFWFYVANKAELRKYEGILQDMGIKRSQIFWIGRSVYLWPDGSKMTDSIDPILGYARMEDEIPGFHIFRSDDSHRDEDKRKIRIVTLGGSTSDPYQVNIKSWPEYLFEQLIDMGINAEVYAGGVGSYTVAQELLKMIRDGIALKPDVVISYSGINDATTLPDLNLPEHPFIRPYIPGMFQYLLDHDKVSSHIFTVHPKNLSLGIRDCESKAEFWIRCQRMIHAVCKEFDIEFYSFLQPQNIQNGVDIPPVKEKTINSFYDEVRLYISRHGDGWMNNLENVFDGKDNIYYDYCHIYERGNRIIAKEIIPVVLKSIQKKQKGRI